MIMIALIWYCKKLEIGKVKPNLFSMKRKIDLDKFKKIKEKKVITPWITIESKDDEKCFVDFEKDIKELCEHFKTKKIVLLPFVHLNSRIPPYENSYELLVKLEIFLSNLDYDVKLAHFGSAKDLKFFSPADEKQVVLRNYGGFSKTPVVKEIPSVIKLDKKDKKEEEKKKLVKESTLLNKIKKDKNIEKKEKKVLKSKPEKTKKQKEVVAPKNKEETKKEWTSSLYNLAPSSRKK